MRLEARGVLTALVALLGGCLADTDSYEDTGSAELSAQTRQLQENVVLSRVPLGAVYSLGTLWLGGLPESTDAENRDYFAVALYTTAAVKELPLKDTAELAELGAEVLRYRGDTGAVVDGPFSIKLKRRRKESNEEPNDPAPAFAHEGWQYVVSAQVWKDDGHISLKLAASGVIVGQSFPPLAKRREY